MSPTHYTSAQFTTTHHRSDAHTDQYRLHSLVSHREVPQEQTTVYTSSATKHVRTTVDEHTQQETTLRAVEQPRSRSAKVATMTTMSHSRENQSAVTFTTEHNTQGRSSMSITTQRNTQDRSSMSFTTQHNTQDRSALNFTKQHNT